MSIIVENIPAELRDRPQWVPWRFEKKQNDAKPRKVPKLWNDKGNAKPNDPNTWTTLENALASYRVRAYAGIAYMLAPDDPFTMFDEDDCIDAEGKVNGRAQETVDRFKTYTEISNSGKGVKGIARGKFTGKGAKVGDQEIYCRDRMFCATGNHLSGTPTTIADNQPAVDWFYGKLTADRKAKRPRRERRGASPDVSEFNQDELVERAWKYIAKCPDALSGDNGHSKTFRAACECFRFGLDDEHAAEVMQRFNAEKTGDEQWDDDELQHKLDDARREVEAANEFGIRLKSNLLDKKDPLPTARRFIGDRFSHPEHPCLIFVDDEFYTFNGTHWQILERAAMRSRLYPFLERFDVAVPRGDLLEIVPFKPTSRDVDNVTDALRAVIYTPVRSPAWIVPDDNAPAPESLIVARNGIFTLNHSGELVKSFDPTPRLFTTTALDYDLLLNAAPPLQWLEFLDTIFESDQAQIELLQEWAGYVLTLDTRQQKMLLLIGPPRSGKGTIARILSRMIGLANVCGPTLAGLGTNFGLWPLHGKALAVISDARLSGRTDQAIVVERLLSISGEDSLTIDRKNRELITAKLTTRIMLLSNELPKLADASGALAHRFLILSLRKSFLGEEDTMLTDRLATELPGIASWAIGGLVRLTDEGRFTQPQAADQIREALNDLGSPISAFVREWCRIEPGADTVMSDLFFAWCVWCDEQGRRDHGTLQTFGRDLRAAVPGLGTSQPSEEGKRIRKYEGIRLTESAQASVAVARAREGTSQNGNGSARDGTRSNPVYVTREGNGHAA